VSVANVPSASAELVSVVIVNYNRRDDLRTALRSVQRQDYPRVEMIVVDNVSTDGSREMLRAEFPEVKLIASEENLGMDGYSVGFREARGEYVFQMDNDSEMPDTNVLSEVVRRFREGPPTLGVVATRVEDVRPGDDVEAFRRRDLRRGPVNKRQFHSGGVGFRRSMLDQVGYYNRDVFLYGAEMFVEIKFLAAGYQVLYYPEILMLHRYSLSSRSSRFFYYSARNRYWYIRCHASPWQRVRHLPSMLLYDLGQSIWKRRPGAYFKAIWEGFGPLPESLRRTPRSDQPDYVARIDEVAADFSFRRMFRNVLARVRGAQVWR
jgi:GT2 family glycosyltransferase